MSNNTQPNATALTPQQESAAEMLAAGRRISAIARALSIDRATLWRWTRLTAFQEAVNVLRRAAWRSAADRMRANTGRAARVLEQILADSGADPRVRVAAARVVLNAVGTLYPENDVGTSLLEARGVPTVTPPNSWSDLAFAAARKADKMTGGLGVAMSATPGAAWAESGLEEAFPGSFQHLKSLADRPDEAAKFCEDLLARYEDMVDREALKESGEA